MTDDQSIIGAIVVFRRIQPQYINLDINGVAVMSDGAFRTKELSIFRSDRVTEADVLKGYPNDGLAAITIQDIRDAGCIIVVDEPPAGHLIAYRSDNPGQRISSTSATKMARLARWVRPPKNP
jgi:hypothetical protein